jgi:hypothetical protein
VEESDQNLYSDSDLLDTPRKVPVMAVGLTSGQAEYDAWVAAAVITMYGAQIKRWFYALVYEFLLTPSIRSEMATDFMDFRIYVSNTGSWKSPGVFFHVVNNISKVISVSYLSLESLVGIFFSTLYRSQTRKWILIELGKLLERIQVFKAKCV